MYNLPPSWPKDQRIFHVFILYTHHTEVTISFGHGLNSISHVLLYPMGNTLPLGYLPSLKSGRGRTLRGYQYIHKCIYIMYTFYLKCSCG